MVLLFLINPSAVTLSCLLSRAPLLSSCPVLLFRMCLCSFFFLLLFPELSTPPPPPLCFFPADTFPVRCCLKPVGRCAGTGAGADVCRRSLTSRLHPLRAWLIDFTHISEKGVIFFPPFSRAGELPPPLSGRVSRLFADGFVLTPGATQAQLESIFFLKGDAICVNLWNWMR